jgi:hypothetical protein
MRSHLLINHPEPFLVILDTVYTCILLEVGPFGQKRVQIPFLLKIKTPYM